MLESMCAHKVKGVREGIEAVGATQRHLPPYSRELNPIESCWSKVRQGINSAAARAVDTIIEPVKVAIDAVTGKDARTSFGRCRSHHEPLWSPR